MGGKKTLKQKQQAMAQESSNAESKQGQVMTQNEGKFNIPSRPGV